MSETIEVPSGWVREELIAGMKTVGRDGYKGVGGGYKCDRCEHFIPIEALDDDVCPSCGRAGMIGTVIMGTQEVTSLHPEGWFSGD